MLQLRPNCEACDRDLAPESPDARICSFECTFCAECADGPLNGHCPNCGGNLERRPIRPAASLVKHPASTQRVLRK
jgi:hypothetical protein